MNIDDVLWYGPCISREEIIEIMGDKDWSAQDIIDAANIKPEYKVWALLRGNFFGNRDLQMMAAAFAEHLLPNFERRCPTDKTPRDAIMTARLLALGEIDRKEATAYAYAANYTAMNLLLPGELKAHESARVAYIAAKTDNSAMTAYISYFTEAWDFQLSVIETYWRAKCENTRG